jgi:hypothetical protein
MKKKPDQSFQDENREYRYAGIKLGYAKIKTSGECFEIHGFKRYNNHLYVHLIHKDQITNSIFPATFKMYIEKVTFVSLNEYLTQEVVES